MRRVAGLAALAALLSLQASAAAKLTHIERPVLAYIGVNLNSANTDHAIPVPSAYARYIVRRVTITNASTSLAVSLATVGVFTSSGGGGTTVVTAAVVTSLTGASKFTDMTVAASTDTLTSATLYVRTGIANGSAATADAYIELQPIS